MLFLQCSKDGVHHDADGLRVFEGLGVKVLDAPGDRRVGAIAGAFSGSPGLWEARLGGAGLDQHHLDAEGCQLEAQSFRPAFQGEFRGVVERGAGHASLACDAADRDQAPLGCPQVGQTGSGTVQNPEEIHGHDRLDLFWIQVLEASKQPHAGVGDQGVESSVALNHVCHHLFHPDAIHHVQEDHLDPIGLQFGLGAVVAQGCDDGSALASQGPGSVVTDTAGATGDERDGGHLWIVAPA